MGEMAKRPCCHCKSENLGEAALLRGDLEMQRSSAGGKRFRGPVVQWTGPSLYPEDSPRDKQDKSFSSTVLSYPSWSLRCGFDRQDSTILLVCHAVVVAAKPQTPIVDSPP
ncbi:uncharacterized protein LOC144307984 [Canis aureus]